MSREKKAKSRKPKELSRKDKAIILAVLLLLSAFILFAFNTVLSNNVYVHDSRLLQIDEKETTLYMGEVGGHRFALRYSGDTEFTRAHEQVLPSSKLLGMRVHVHYRKSVFAADYAFKVELRE